MNQSARTIRSRGIYLLPNLLTLAGFFAAFYAIIAAAQQRYEVAAVAILVAMIMDGLDGRVARMINAESEFGAQLDSLADMVAFGVAPAMVFYFWSLHRLGKVGWLCAFIYAACTALRLARFNIQPTKRHFQGLSTTAAAGFTASFVWAATDSGFAGDQHALFVLVVAVIISFLKVSTIRYYSFKGINLSNKVPFYVILLLVAALVLIALDPPNVILLILLIYVLSGPVQTVWRLRNHRRRKIAKKRHKKRQQ